MHKYILFSFFVAPEERERNEKARPLALKGPMAPQAFLLSPFFVITFNSPLQAACDQQCALRLLDMRACTSASIKIPHLSLCTNPHHYRDTHTYTTIGIYLPAVTPLRHFPFSFMLCKDPIPIPCPTPLTNAQTHIYTQHMTIVPH
jgi:hypothetical protein